MAYWHVRLSADGKKVTIRNGMVRVPNPSIIGDIERNGIGPDISRARLRIGDAAADKAGDGQHKIHWREVLFDEKAAGTNDGGVCPDQTVAALSPRLTSSMRAKNSAGNSNDGRDIRSGNPEAQ